MSEFKRLNEVSGKQSQLQVIVNRARLIREQGGKKSLLVEIEENPEVILAQKEGQAHAEACSSDWFKRRLEAFRAGDSEEVVIADSQNPLIVNVGDVCLILRIEGKDYLVSFYRDIHLQGWVIPGGNPTNFEEVFDPKTVAFREAREELIIGDTQRTFYFIGVFKKELELNIERWKSTPKKIISLPYQELFFENGDAQNLILQMPGRGATKIENVNVTVDPYYVAVFLTFYLQVELPIKLSELCLFDGETLPGGGLLNRLVRLIDKKGEIAAIFTYGQNVLSADWNNPATKKRVSIA